MKKLREFFSRLAGSFNRRRQDQDLAEELASHLQFHIEDNRRAGFSPAEARRQALLQLGGLDSTKEACRDQRGLPFLESLWMDLRYAARQLRRNPAFAAVAALTLALGIGANTVVFSVAKAVLFRPLGFAEENGLMWLQLVNTQTGAIEDRLSWREMEDIRENTRSFEAVGTFGASGVRWQQGDRAEIHELLEATPQLPAILRVRPVLGRLFETADAARSSPPVVMIGYELWQNRFDGASNIIGQTARIEDKTRTIIGVLPPGLEFPMERAPKLGTGGALVPGIRSFWTPMPEPEGPDLTARQNRMFLPVARLKPGVTEAAARAELATLGQRLAKDHPESNRHTTFALVSFRDQILGQTRRAIPLLAIAVAGVLLICCVNLANLLLARSLARQRELAVRLALGAGRSRIVRALMIESLLLAALGGALGIFFAHISLAAIRQMAAANIPFIREAAVDAPAIAFTCGLAILTAALFGLLPALRQSRGDASDSLRGGARMTGGPQIRAWQRGLLIGQIAIVIVLLASAALLLESFRRLLGEDLGYQTRSVVAIDLSNRDFDTNAGVCQMYRVMRERLAAIPGVEFVGTVSSAPLTAKWTFSEKAQVVGQPRPEEDRPALAANFVAFDYFQAMGIPLLEGRHFRDSELKDDGYGQIVIINESAAKALFPERSAIGGRFTVGSNSDRILEVIGVVKDTRDEQLGAKPQPRFYWQYAFGGAQVVVRTSAPAQAILPQLRAEAEKVDARNTIHSVRTMTEIVSGTVAERRFLMTLLTAYAAVALGVAVVGIFGIVAYQVAQRASEFGIRLALGSTPKALLRLVLAQAARMVAAGIVLGLLASLATGRLLQSQLYELSPHDPFLLGAVSILVLVASLAASAWPATRAARTDPMTALRAE